MTMFEKMIEVDTRIVVPFTEDPAIRLYMSTTYSGDHIHPTKAGLLECWQFRPDSPRDRLPDLNPLWMAYSILYAPHRSPGYAFSFYQCASDMAGSAIRQWMMHLYRHPDDDLHLPHITIVQGTRYVPR